MNKDFTIEELSKNLVLLGRKKHGSDCAHAFALGTIMGLTDFYLKHNMLDRLQSAVNDRFIQTQKDLETI